MSGSPGLAPEQTRPAEEWSPLPQTWAGPPPGVVDCIRVRPGEIAPDAWPALRAGLAAGEAERAERYLPADDRARAVAGRGVLRLLLARSGAASSAEAVRLVEGPWGKPAAPGGPAFNLSHGGEMILLAFAPEGEVGVDVEPLAAGVDWREVVGRLHPAERAAIATAADPARAFIRLWTRKEALAKAAGVGLAAQPPDAWSVEAGPPGWAPPGGWSAFELAPDAAHAGAVVASGRPRLRCWSFVPPP